MNRVAEVAAIASAARSRSACSSILVGSVLVRALPRARTGTSSPRGPRSSARRAAASRRRSSARSCSSRSRSAIALPDRRPRRDLRQRVRAAAGRRAGEALARRPQRLPVDRDRHLRLRADRRRGRAGARASATTRARGPAASRSRSSCCRCRAHDDGGARARAEQPPRGELRARRLQVADGPERRAAERARRHRHRDDARGRPRGGRDGAAPLHLLDLRAGRQHDPSHPVALDPGDHLRVLGVARQEPERAGLGGGVRPDHLRARDEPRRAAACSTARAASSARSSSADSRVHHPVTRSVTPLQPTSAAAAGTVATRTSISQDKERTHEEEGTRPSRLAALSPCCRRPPPAHRHSATVLTARAARSSRRSSRSWTPALGIGVRLHAPVRRRRLRRRHPGDHEPLGRLRRLRRAADARPVQRRATAASRSRGRSPARRSTTTSRASRCRRTRTCGSTRRRDREDLHGQITNWNDPAIKTLNPKATLPT